MGKLLPLFWVAIFFCTGQIKAQDTINVVFYNLLNFQNGGGGIVNRQDTLAKILTHLAPDVLLVCELSNSTGASQVLSNSLNINGITYYQAGIYQNNTSTSNSLQNLIYYNSNKLKFHSQLILPTDLRDINKYVLYHNDPNLPSNDDTTFIDFYVTHLKASNGSTNKNRRNLEITVLRDHVNTNPSLRNSVFGADLNVYTSSESGYQTILNSGTYPFTDPISSPGSWNNNSSFAAIHTQSTRTFQLGGDGASGGMDDRFDQILTSANVISGADRVQYIPGSYRAVGQDGNHFNQNLNDAPPNLSEPADIIRALFYMSDHLPVFMQLEITPPISLPTSALNPFVRPLGNHLEVGSTINTGRNAASLQIERSQLGEPYVEILDERVFPGKTAQTDDIPPNNGEVNYRFVLRNQDGNLLETELLKTIFQSNSISEFIAIPYENGVELTFRPGQFQKGWIRVQDLWGRLLFSKKYDLDSPTGRIFINYPLESSQLNFISVYDFENKFSGIKRIWRMKPGN